AFLAEIAFFDHSLHARREIEVELADERPGIYEVDASRPERTGGKTYLASDAAMRIHHHDTVRPSERGARGADPHTRRVVAVVAENRYNLFSDVLLNVRMTLR